MFYQLLIAPNDKATLFSRLLMYKLTSRTTLSFAANY